MPQEELGPGASSAGDSPRCGATSLPLLPSCEQPVSAGDMGASGPNTASLTAALPSERNQRGFAEEEVRAREKPQRDSRDTPAAKT